MESSYLKNRFKIPSTFSVNVENDEGISEKTYQNIKILGKGHYGITYLCLDDYINKQFAIKFLSKKEDAIKEINCLNRIKSICGKRLLCYYGNFRYRNNDNILLYGIITEFEEGYAQLVKYFEERIEEGQYITNTEKNNILKQIQEGINELIKVGIFHNDLHPGNILIEPKSGNVKIIDFGSCDDNKQNIIDKYEEVMQDFSIMLDDFADLSLISNLDK